MTYRLMVLLAALTLGFDAGQAQAQKGWIEATDPAETPGERSGPGPESTGLDPNVEIEANSTTSASIAPGTQVQSRIDYPGDADWFQAALQAGQRYQIDLMTGGPGGPPLGDPYLELYDARSVLVTQDDDAGSDKNARILYRAETDQTVFLAAKAYSDNTGAYTLALTELATPEPIAPGASVNGMIRPDQPAVQYAVELEAGQSYLFTLVGQAGGGGTLADPLLRVLDTNLVKVAENDDHEGTRDSRIVFEPVAAGEYLLEAAAIGDNYGSYTLTVDTYAAPANEIGDTPETAGVLTSQTPVQDRIDIPGDKDWFAVDLVAGGRYVFRLHGSPSGEGTLGDSYLQLLDGNAQEIASNDDYESTTNSRIQFTAPDTGRYFIVASGLSEHTGTYTLSMEAEGGAAQATTDDIRIVVELVDGQRITLRLQRSFLAEVNTIWIGPDIIEGSPRQE